MRFEPKQHPLVAGVINHFEMETKEFPMGTLVGVKYEDGEKIPQYSTADNIMYLRGKHFREKDLVDPNVEIPYNLSWSLKGKNADDLQKFAMNHILPHATKNVSTFNPPVYGTHAGEPLEGNGYTSEEMLNPDFKVYDHPFREYGYWNLLQRTLGNEGFTLMKDANGYDSNVPNGSSPALLPVADYGASTHFKTLVKGYDHLPKRIHQEYTNNGKFYSYCSLHY